MPPRKSDKNKRGRANSPKTDNYNNHSATRARGSVTPDHDEPSQIQVPSAQQRLYRKIPNEKDESEVQNPIPGTSQSNSPQPRLSQPDASQSDDSQTDTTHWLRSVPNTPELNDLLAEREGSSSLFREISPQASESAPKMNIPRLDTNTSRLAPENIPQQKIGNRSSERVTPDDLLTRTSDSTVQALAPGENNRQSQCSQYAPDIDRRFSDINNFGPTSTNSQTSPAENAKTNDDAQGDISPRNNNSDVPLVPRTAPQSLERLGSASESPQDCPSRSLRNNSRAAIAGFRQNANGELVDMNPDDTDIVDGPDGIKVTRQLIESGLLEEAYTTRKVSAIKDFERMIFHLFYANQDLPNIRNLLLRNRKRLQEDLEEANVPTPISARGFLEESIEASEDELVRDKRGRRVVQIARQLLEKQPLDNAQTRDFVFLLEEEFVVIMVKRGYLDTVFAMFRTFSKVSRMVTDFLCDHITGLSILVSILALMYVFYASLPAIGTATESNFDCSAPISGAGSTEGAAIPLTQDNFALATNPTILLWNRPPISILSNLYNYGLRLACLTTLFNRFFRTCSDLVSSGPVGFICGIITLAANLNSLCYIGLRAWDMVLNRASELQILLKKHSYISCPVAFLITIGVIDAISQKMFDLSPVRAFLQHLHWLIQSFIEDLPPWAIVLGIIVVFSLVAAWLIETDEWWATKVTELKYASFGTLKTFKEGVSYSVVTSVFVLVTIWSADYMLGGSGQERLATSVGHDDVLTRIIACSVAFLALTILLFFVHLGPKRITKGLKSSYVFLAQGTWNVWEHHPLITLGIILVLCVAFLERNFGSLTLLADWLGWRPLFGLVVIAIFCYVFIVPLWSKLQRSLHEIFDEISNGKWRLYVTKWLSTTFNHVLQVLACPKEIRNHFRLFVWVVVAAALVGNVMRAPIFFLQAQQNALDVKVSWSDDVDQPVVYLT